MTYWICFAFFLVFEAFGDILLFWCKTRPALAARHRLSLFFLRRRGPHSYRRPLILRRSRLPFYYEAKVILLLLLLAPTLNVRLRRRLLLPLLRLPHLLTCFFFFLLHFFSLASGARVCLQDGHPAHLEHP